MACYSNCRIMILNCILHTVYYCDTVLYASLSTHTHTDIQLNFQILYNCFSVFRLSDSSLLLFPPLSLCLSSSDPLCCRYSLDPPSNPHLLLILAACSFSITHISISSAPPFLYHPCLLPSYFTPIHIIICYLIHFIFPLNPSTAFVFLSKLSSILPSYTSYSCFSTFNPFVSCVVIVSVLCASVCPVSLGDSSLSSASTLEHITTSATARPRPLVRQQSLQQPLTHQPPPGPNDPPATSQSLGQLHMGPGGGGHRGSPRGVRGSAAGASRYRGVGAGRSRSNPGSWDHMMGQIRNRGLDVKSFL